MAAESPGAHETGSARWIEWNDWPVSVVWAVGFFGGLSLYMILAGLGVIPV